MTVYFNADIHSLKATTSNNLNDPEPHIRLLWLSKEESSQILFIDCEVDTVGSFNIFPLYKVKALFGENI